MADSSRTIAATLIGALIGGAAGYLFFSEHGRGVRRSLEPALDDFARELSSFRGTLQRAASVATESWNLLNETLGETAVPPRRFPSAHQSSPF